jgi:hypothetical protein
MPEYTLVVRIPQAGDREINHSINLEGLDEDYPADYFRQPVRREEIARTIETKSARQLSPNHLNAAIDKWIDEIGRGIRRTHVTLELPPSVASSPPVHPPAPVAVEKPPTPTPPSPKPRLPFPGTQPVSTTATPLPVLSVPSVPSESSEPPPNICNGDNQADF